MPDIVAHVIASIPPSRPLPKWMTVPMELRESRPALAVHLQNRVSMRCRGLPHFVAPRWLGRTCLLSGGFMAQLATDLEWPYDLDVFTQGTQGQEGPQEDFRLKTKLGNHDVDFVQRAEDPLTVMSGFDLSICQVGIRIERDEFSQVYCTPLFLYSLHYQRLVWRVTDLAGLYLPTTYFAPHVILSRVYRDHVKYGHDQPFHRCLLYSCSGAHEVIDGCPMHRWYQRVEKYVARFPDWSMDFFEGAA
jgi:hypothetical protein